MSANDIEEVSFSDYVKMARIAIKGMEESKCHIDPATAVYNDSKVKVLENELSDAYDLIKVLAYLYEKSYITIVNLQQPTSSNPMIAVGQESPIDKMKRLIPGSVENVQRSKSYSPKLKRRVLPDSTAAMIRTMLEAGVPNCVIAKQLDIDAGIISGIDAGLTYRGTVLPIKTEEQEEQDN